MKKLVKQRNRLAPVRLECAHPLKGFLFDTLSEKLGLSRPQIYVSHAPFLMNYVSVFYTHLDVYKRQVGHHPAGRYPSHAHVQRRGGRNCQLFAFHSLHHSAGDALPGHARGDGPVSYTHLDVYKRQAGRFAGTIGRLFIPLKSLNVF